MLQPKLRGSPSRARMVREVRRLGYDGWRDKYRYGYRWMVETFFSGVKRVFGETCRAKTHRGSIQGGRNEIHLLRYAVEPLSFLYILS